MTATKTTRNLSLDTRFVIGKMPDTTTLKHIINESRILNPNQQGDIEIGAATILVAVR